MMFTSEFISLLSSLPSSEEAKSAHILTDATFPQENKNFVYNIRLVC